MATPVDINVLPEEMLIEIFKNFDRISYTEACSVCKKWNQLLSTTPAIMKNFCLKVDKNVLIHRDKQTRKRFRHLMRLKRHYTSAAIDTTEYFRKNRLLDIVEHYGPNLTSLKLKCVYLSCRLSIVTCRILIRILEHTPKLEELAVNSYSCDDCREACTRYSVGSVTLSHLKKLEIHGNWNTLQLVEAPSLEDLSLKEEVPHIYSECVNNFLKASTKLRRLEISLDCLNALDATFSFQLKTISIGHFYCRSKEINEKVMKFILKQAPTLETLQLAHSFWDSKFHEMVLTKFYKLKVLDSNLVMLKVSPKFYSNLKPLPLLRELISSKGFSNAKTMRAILKNCSQLVKLACPRDQSLPRNLDFIAENCKNLEVLEILKVESTTARFQRLKTLTIHKIKEIDDLIAFLKANPNVKNLFFKTGAGCISETALKNLINGTDLKNIEVSSSSCISCNRFREMYDVLKSGSLTSKELQVQVIEWSNGRIYECLTISIVS